MSEDNDEYMKVSDEIDDLRFGDGKERAKAGLKILGKSMFNVGKFVAKEVLPALAEKAEEKRKQ